MLFENPSLFFFTLTDSGRMTIDFSPSIFHSGWKLKAGCLKEIKVDGNELYTDYPAG
jgi:hypothetical protein